MAKSGSEILNPRTGQRTIFLQTAADTGGKLLRMESFHPAQSPLSQSMCIHFKRVAVN